jgi:pilus assembly protein Flp/PilA
MRTRISKFVKSDKGATAVEYGLMVGLIAIVIIASVTLLGTRLAALFAAVAAAIPAA